MADRVSQGYRLIEDIKKRVGPLADWTRQFKPQQMHLTVTRNDHDILLRWPKASHAHELDLVGNKEVWYRGLEVTYDGGPRRYQKAASPSQVDLEELAGRPPAPS